MNDGTPNPTQVGGDFKAASLNLPHVIANPYPYYALLRDQPPQFGLKDWPPGTVPGQDPPQPSWVLLKYADVAAAAKNHDAFSSRDPMQEESDAPTLMLVNDDRPRHTMLRNIAKQAFTPKRVEQDVAPWVASTATAMVAELEDGEVEFMDRYAEVLPAKVMTHLIGTPLADFDKLRRWASAFMVTSDFTMEERNQCNIEIATYYTEAVNERYRDIERGLDAPDDLMTAFIKAQDEGQFLSRDEVIRFCLTLVVAGAETTGYLLGNLVCTLAEEPEFFQRLKQDRSLVRPFIEESLRRDGPPQRLFRVASTDVEIGGAQIRKGDWVALFYASANRDPAMFENPDRFVLGRPTAGRHLTFGHGIHHCMGAGIARLEADKMINGILDRCSRVELGSAPMKRQTGGLLNYGLDQCPVVLAT
ncbi:cytochrome P450 [Panacagrimonas sp.]|uniref:cytochrome P450 n=1 Tax=Panacagrimonas sp. TaxID=2480088 RepID=UPI003B518AFA